MKTFEIWEEGYRINGNFSQAVKAGIAKGNTFKEACVSLYKTDKLYSKEDNTYWGCRLFDNETDARKAFG